ncbi:MAG: YggS family pyridoxal phosphate-dependent enzyme [Alphaproteobacteria bacterium]
MGHDPIKALAEVQAKITKASQAATPVAAEINLIAVSKTHAAHHIHPLLEAGHIHFGENRVQEAQQKWPALKADFPNTKLHLIGPLQTNKIKDALALFDVWHTLDRPKLARKLADAVQTSGHCPDLFIQVNTGEEAQKAGIAPQEADQFIAQCRDDFGLPIIGLMAIPPADQTASPHFALLEKIARRNGLTQLSMGMSGDYETAIQFGATHVRVGTSIFGKRDTPPQLEPRD